MNDLFLHILNMSITAGWVVMAVVLLRFCFRRTPKWISVLLWGMVAVRLLLPFSIESSLSMLPTAETVPSEILYTQTPQIQSGIPTVNNLINPVLRESFAPKAEASVTSVESANPMQELTTVAAWVWLAGMLLMLGSFAVSYLLLRRKMREAVRLQDNIWICDQAATPFLLGVFRTRIYLPSTLSVQDSAYVIAHEQAHLRRRDHLWKPLGFLLLSVYWFHPLLWLAYALLCRDIEHACDEKVLNTLGAEGKKPYSDALINCSAPRRMFTACPLAFGETDVKTRVKSVLHYKKPTLWVLIVALVISSVAAVRFLTDPPTEKTDSGVPSVAEQSLHTPDKENTENSGSEEEGAPETPISYLLWLTVEESDSSAEITLPEFPGVTFLYRKTRSWDEEILVSREGKETLLFSGGMPITQAVFADLNGDGKRELMLSYYLGSGFISSHVFIYDYAAQKAYHLGERGRSDCTLAVGSDAVYVAYYPTRYHLDSSAVLSRPVLVETGGETVVELSEPFAQDSNGTTVAIGHTFTKKDPVDEMDKITSITLYADCTFSFQFGVLSSYWGHGNFSLEDGQLVLYSQDGKYTYRFDIMEDTLVFREEGSSDMDWYANLYDGCVFQ